MDHHFRSLRDRVLLRRVELEEKTPADHLPRTSFCSSVRWS
jgi:hypothetical protein